MTLFKLLDFWELSFFTLKNLFGELSFEIKLFSVQVHTITKAHMFPWKKKWPLPAAKIYLINMNYILIT